MLDLVADVLVALPVEPSISLTIFGWTPRLSNREAAECLALWNGIAGDLALSEPTFAAADPRLQPPEKPAPFGRLVGPARGGRTV